MRFATGVTPKMVAELVDESYFLSQIKANAVMVILRAGIIQMDKCPLVLVRVVERMESTI